MNDVVAWGLVVAIIGLVCAVLILEHRVATLEAQLRELEELAGYRERKS